MRQSLAILSMLAVSGAIAADTISFFFPGDSEGVDPVATIKAVKPSTTEFKIACPTGVDSSDCGWGPGLDYTIVSGTHYQAQMTAGSVSMSYACDHNTKATEMTCTVAMTGGNVGGLGPQTAVLKGNDIKFNTATVVQGASLLGGSSGATPMATPVTTGGLMVASTSPPATGSGKGTGTPTSGPATQHTGAATKLGLQTSALIALAGVVGMGVW